MKFKIKKDDSIMLYQLLKGADVLESYNEIRVAISSGQVSVNDKCIMKQRHELVVGDIVHYQTSHVKIVDEMEKTSLDSTDKLPKLKHGRANTWAHKPLDMEKKLNDDIHVAAKRLHEKLFAEKLSLSLAESCTGGLVQAELTAFPGSSVYFLGGVVSYAYEVKEKMLKVKDLEKNGAVSRETAEQMAVGVKNLFGSDISGAITGIAGPDGGTDDKPVGTVHMAVNINGKTRHVRYQYTGDRARVRKKSVLGLINLFLQYL